MGVAPRNFNAHRALETKLAQAVRTGKRSPVREITALNRATGGCTGHMSAREIRNWVPKAFWDSAYKFTTERHPYEKALSLAYFRYKGETARQMSFDDHLDHTIRHDHKLYSNYRLYSIDGQSVMNGFLRHDTLADDMQSLRERLNLPLFDLPQARNRRTARRPAAEVLSEAQKKIIVGRCKLEFEFFDWKK